jgi:hypothetical protein
MTWTKRAINFASDERATLRAWLVSASSRDDPYFAKAFIIQCAGR